MKLTDYVKFGVNHHLLYADKIETPEAHLDTLKRLLGDPRFEMIDMWFPAEISKESVEAVRKSGKTVYYNIGTRPGKQRLAPAAMDAEERKYARHIYMLEMERAKACQAEKIITNSGPNDSAHRKECMDWLVDFYCDYCACAAPIMVIIEPTDWDMSKCKLIGSSAEAAEICRRVREKGFSNLGSMIDMCHIPLMHENLSQAFADTGQYLEHIHLGNCVIRRDSPYYGDTHPGIGIEDGEFGAEDFASLFRLGLDGGYFSTTKRGSASIEMRAFPGKSAEDSLDEYYSAICRCWDIAVKRKT
jgi:sugar phosphate isomerase/epimerase